MGKTIYVETARSSYSRSRSRSKSYDRRKRRVRRPSPSDRCFVCRKSGHWYFLDF